MIRIVFATFILGLVWSAEALADDVTCEPDQGKVSRAMFTTNIDDREPVDRVLILENNVDQLYFFSDLRHLQGETIKHRWEFEGRVMKEKVFTVQGPRWRVYSINKMDKNMLGRWTVVITDKNDCPLRAVIFQYVQSGQGSGPAIVNLR